MGLCVPLHLRLPAGGLTRPHLYPDWAHPSPAPHHYPRTHDTRALALQHALAWLLPYQHLPAHASTHAGTHTSYYTGLRARVLGARVLGARARNPSARSPRTERGNGPPQINKQASKAQNGWPPSRTSAPRLPLLLCFPGGRYSLSLRVWVRSAATRRCRWECGQRSMLQRSTACCTAA